MFNCVPFPPKMAKMNQRDRNARTPPQFNSISLVLEILMLMRMLSMSFLVSPAACGAVRNYCPVAFWGSCSDCASRFLLFFFLHERRGKRATTCVCSLIFWFLLRPLPLSLPFAIFFVPAATGAIYLGGGI